MTNVAVKPRPWSIEFDDTFTVIVDKIVSIQKVDESSTKIYCNDNGRPYFTNEPYKTVLKKINGDV